MTTPPTEPFYSPWDDAESALASLRQQLRQERDMSSALRGQLSRAWSENRALARGASPAIVCVGATVRLEDFPAMGRRAAERLEQAHFELELIHGLGLGEQRRATVWSAVLLVGEARLLLDQAKEGWT